MVSHLDLQQQLSSHGRAPSVSSRASSSRRHRHHRSHHGGSSHNPQNEFPIFSQTGDVEIIISSVNGRKESRYLLHRLILSQCSGFFDVDTRKTANRAIIAGPSGAPAQPVTGSLARIGERDSSTSDVASLQSGGGHHDRQMWKYVLDWGNTDDAEEPILVQRPATGRYSTDPGPPPVSRNKPPASSASFFRSMSNFSALNLNDQPQTAPDADDELLRDYDNLFRIFYNYTPTLNAVNIADAYTECKALINLAEIYDCQEVIGPRIDHHLLGFGNRLFKQIAKYPPFYLKLGFLAQSKTIFAEALIHVVGQWPLHRPQLERSIDSSVIDLIEDNSEAIEDTKSKVEGKLFRLTLTTSRGERITPSNSFLDWLAMSLFRQWLAENTTPAPVSILKDPNRPGSNGTNASAAAAASMTSRHPSASSSPRHAAPASTAQSSSTNRVATMQSVSPARVFRLLGSSNKEAYLPHDELKRFLKSAPDGFYTRENVRRFERRIDELKNLARDVVKPLTRNCLELDLAAAGLEGGALGSGLGYLTCCKVGQEDFPWDD